MCYSKETEKGKTVVSSKTSVFKRSLYTVFNRISTFTDQSRNIFGVNSAIFIYTEIILFGGLRSNDGG